MLKLGSWVGVVVCSVVWFVMGTGAGVAAADAPAGRQGQVAGGEGLAFYVGTYNQRGSQGIYQFVMDPATGAITPGGLAAEAKNPSFLTLDATGQYVYAVGEISEFEGRRVGAVSAFARDRASGRLRLLNQQPSGGAGPCHVSLTPNGRVVLAANYGGGSVTAIPVEADGRLGMPVSVIQHQGSSINPQRQKGPHAHSIHSSPDGRFALAADLGLDKVLVYRIDPADGRLAPHDPPHAVVTPGGGPRHLAFAPDGRRVYVNSELTSKLTVFDYDAAAGRLVAKQEISTLPADEGGRNSTAEVVVHPTGRFVYCSNRGHNSIAAFAVEAATGQLTAVGHAREGIKTPRHFVIDPTGRFVVVANQDADSLVVFAIDGSTGSLTATGHSVAVPAPVCVRFVPMASPAKPATP